MRNYIANNV